MTLTSGIGQQAARSLTSIHRTPSPRPSIELRRIKHVHTESDIKDGFDVRGGVSGGSFAPGDRSPAAPQKVRVRLEVQYACLCLALFLAGWNDGTNGPLIPRIQSYYNVISVADTSPTLHSYSIERRSTLPLSLSSSSLTVWWVYKMRSEEVSAQGFQ